MSGFSISIDLDDIERLAGGISDAAFAAARPAAQAGAQVLVDQVKANVAAIGRKTGNLANSIYQVYSKDRSGNGVAVYHISWNARKAPHGHLVEYGHLQTHQVVLTRKGRWLTLKNKPLASPRQIGARPFVRPAMAQKGEAARRAMEEEFVRQLADKGIVK